MDSDYDADIARAIALSMQDAEKQQNHSKPVSKAVAREVLVISSDEEDDDVLEVPAPTKKTAAEPEAKPAAAGPLSFLADRAQMERERLARHKRVRGPSPPPSNAEDSDSEVESEGSATKRARLNSPPSTSNAAMSSGRRTFPTGAVLRIDTQHADSTRTDKAPCIRLSEILGPKDELAFAILSAFAVDAPWLYEFFANETPVILVTDSNTCGADTADDGPTLKNIFPSWVRVCPPLYNERGCMHMKFMLLFAKSGGLRVVVSSANLVPHDWRHVENYVFVQDVPPATPNTKTRPRPGEKARESFPAMLARVLKAVGVQEALGIMQKQGHTSLPLPSLQSLPLPHKSKPKSSINTPRTALDTQWDWTQVHVALVPSVAGRWSGWTGTDGVLWTGQLRLMRAVQTLGCSLEDLENAASKGKGKGRAKTKGKRADKWEVELDCLTSSIGAYTAPWLAVFRLCASGRAQGVQAWLDRGRKKTPPQGPTRILFPTLETVRGTTMGEPGAGTVFCRRGQWTKIAALIADASTGLKMCDANSRSGPVGMHTKMILGTLLSPPEPEVDPEATENDTESESDSSDIEILEDGPQAETRGKPHAWLYVGSHNFTPSAWGTVSGSGFSPVVTVANYELGVVLWLDTPEDVEQAVAWERPARRYGKGDVPWIQEESPFFRP
ncbi:tyrosyl-DNA phosphodiesterase-domain-containing protein [Mycena sanguinolenta]|nr:tyrosyl-DNA phosphodiesterase-domain-containing protein [Mycena sanguinolenta]